MAVLLGSGMGVSVGTTGVSVGNGEAVGNGFAAMRAMLSRMLARPVRSKYSTRIL